MGKTVTVLLIVLIIVVGVTGYFIYISLNKPIISVEKNGLFNETRAGVGVCPYAMCPEGKKALSGGCASHSQYLEVSGTGELMKSRENLDYYNAWSCCFSLKEDTEYTPHAYTVTVNCQ